MAWQRYPWAGGGSSAAYGQGYVVQRSPLFGTLPLARTGSGTRGPRGGSCGTVPLGHLRSLACGQPSSTGRPRTPSERRPLADLPVQETEPPHCPRVPRPVLQSSSVEFIEETSGRLTSARDGTAPAAHGYRGQSCRCHRGKSERRSLGDLSGGVGPALRLWLADVF